MDRSEPITLEIAEVRRLRLSIAPPLQTAHGTWRTREGFLFRIEGTGVEPFRGIGEAGQVPGFGHRCLEDLLDHTPERSFALWSAVQPHWDPPERIATAVLGSGGEVPPGGRRKLKIGLGPVGEEVEVVKGCCQSLPPGAKLRLDANGGLDRAAFAVWREVLGDERIEYLEQPFPPGAVEYALAEVKAVEEKLALDESVLTYSDWKAVVSGGWRGWGILKPSLAGVPDPEALGDPRVVLSSAFESPVGWLVVAEIALRQNPNLPGLDTLGRFPGCAAYRAENGWIRTHGLKEQIARTWDEAECL